jgi:hypothetical protein
MAPPHTLRLQYEKKTMNEALRAQKDVVISVQLRE